MYRYSAVSHASFSAQIADYDDGMNELPVSTNWVNTLPPMLAKTVIRLYYNASKRVTVTLYYAPGQSSGTLLCQGKDCEQWDLQECEVLKTIVSDYMMHKDFNQLTSSVLNTPLAFLEHPEPLPLTTPDIVATLSDGDVHGDASPSSDWSPLLISCDQYQPLSQGVVVMPPIPPVGETNTPHSQTTTPLRKKMKQYRRRTLCFTPKQDKYKSPLFRACAQKLSRLENSLEDILNENKDVKTTLMSNIDDLKMSVKNEIKARLNEKFDLMMDKFETKISTLEQTLNQMKKENQSLKSQLSNIKSDAKQNKPKLLRDARSEERREGKSVGRV